MSSLAPWQRLRPVLTTLITSAGLVACTSGGSESRFDAEGQLLSITFPNAGSSLDTSEAPTDAPLIQRVVFRFDSRPNPDQVSSQTIHIRDEAGHPVAGSFDVLDHEITFVPTLPTADVSLRPDGTWDTGGAGLTPGSSYTIRLGARTWSFVRSIASDVAELFADPTDPDGVALRFETTTDEERFFDGLDPREPTWISSTPSDGASGVSPHLYSDPGGRFDEPTPFRIRFDGPLHPSATHLEQFALVDLQDPEHPAGLSLGVDVRIVENTLVSGVVEIEPAGILPLGRLLSLEIPDRIRGLSQDAIEDPNSMIVATFTTAGDETRTDDALVEDFHTDERHDSDPDLLEPGELPARWNDSSNQVLQAAFAFEGTGVLGRFIPAPPAEEEEIRSVYLDTTYQVFPLFDGSTPDAPAGYVVSGGQFHFTEIDIPAGVEVVFRGSNAPVLTATESVTIHGEIKISGVDGTPESSFDSSVTSVPGGPGGPGGGNGGENHPRIYWPPDQIGHLHLVSPAAGGRGFGAGNRERVGGGGGESGVVDRPEGGRYHTDIEISCYEPPEGKESKAAGGSGGSWLTNGLLSREGKGNVRPDGVGGWVLTEKDDSPDWKVLSPGAKGISPFQDADPSNNFIGVTGELQDVIGGQGGGGGGSRFEAYYCGQWCKLDEDPANDEGCLGGEFQGRFADSVGDARGGSGGGGGGAITIQTLGAFLLKPGGRILATGGRGGGGETVGRSNFGGPSGGGSGGTVVIQSARSITTRRNSIINVTGGSAPDGGNGGDGVVQLQVPIDQSAEVDSGTIRPPESWVDPSNTLNPARFTPWSAAVSEWFDLGRTIARGNGRSHPGFFFEGLDSLGFVRTDLEGNVLDPELSDIQCDYLGQLDPFRPGHYLDGEEPRADFIPPNASVQVLFQVADAIAPGSKEVDPDSMTTWTSSISKLFNHQFIRYRIRFDLAADGGIPNATTPRPSVQQIRIRTEF